MGRPTWRRRLKGERGRGTLAKDKRPILGLVRRGGELVLRMQRHDYPADQPGYRRCGRADPHRRVRHLRPPGGLGLLAQDGLLYRLSYEMTFWSQGGKQGDLMRPVSATSAFQASQQASMMAS